jgi:hypothetical protein
MYRQNPNHLKTRETLVVGQQMAEIRKQKIY